MNARALALIGLSTWLVACGSSHDAPAASPNIKADVTITLDAAHRTCNVALATEPHASSVPCAEVARFLRDELRLPSGAVFNLRSDGTSAAADVEAIADSLKAAGYRPGS